MSKNRQNDKLITRSEAAEILKVEAQTLAVWKTKKRYDLPVVIIGSKTVRYWRSDVEEFRDRNLKP